MLIPHHAVTESTEAVMRDLRDYLHPIIDVINLAWWIENLSDLEREKIETPRELSSIIVRARAKIEEQN
jgi:hypothetical protein